MKDSRCRKAFDLLETMKVKKDDKSVTDFFRFINDNLPYVYENIDNVTPTMAFSESFRKIVKEVEDNFCYSEWSNREHDTFSVGFVTGIIRGIFTDYSIKYLLKSNSTCSEFLKNFRNVLQFAKV